MFYSLFKNSSLPFNEFIKRASQDTQTDYFIDKDEK